MTITDLQDAATERIVKAMGIVELLRVVDDRQVLPHAVANACWAVNDLLQEARTIIQEGPTE